MCLYCELFKRKINNKKKKKTVVFYTSWKCICNSELSDLKMLSFILLENVFAINCLKEV